MTKIIEEEQIKEIINYLDTHKTIPIKRVLKELPEVKKENEERLKELEEFASEVKRRVRSAGKSMSIGVSDFEDIFVKHNITIKNEKS